MKQPFGQLHWSPMSFFFNEIQGSLARSANFCRRGGVSKSDTCLKSSQDKDGQLVQGGAYPTAALQGSVNPTNWRNARDPGELRWLRVLRIHPKCDRVLLD